MDTVSKNKTYYALDIIDRQSFGSILIISILVSILSLIVPIAAQILVNIVAFARIFQPIVIISLVVLAILIGSAILNVWQYIIVEIIQQKLFADVVIACARRLPFLHPKLYSKYRGPELVNQFFDVITIQKCVADILIYGTNSIISAFFGMLLLALYHPYFLIFDLLLIAAMVLTFYLPYHQAMTMAKIECTEKHRIGSWLEELVLNANLFRFNEHHQFALEEADNRLVNFLKARNKHFRMIIRHIASTHAITAVATCVLLGLGGYLVIKNKLSLGQLVAAEIVLGNLTSSFKHLAALLKDYYDMIASADKVDQLVNLEQETQEITITKNSFHKYPTQFIIKIDNFRANNLSKKASLTGIAKPGEPLCFSIADLDHAQVLIDTLSGFPTSYDGVVQLNELKTNHHVWYDLRKVITRLNRIEIFAGTIEDNLLMGQQITSEKLYHWLAIFNLHETILNLPEGLKTKITHNEVVFSPSQLKMIMLVRTMIVNPRLLILDQFLDDLPEKNLQLVATNLKEVNNLTIILTSRSEKIIAEFNSVMRSKS